MIAKDVFIKKDGVCILWGEFYKNMPFLDESLESAHATITVKIPNSAKPVSKTKAVNHTSNAPKSAKAAKSFDH